MGACVCVVGGQGAGRAGICVWMWVHMYVRAYVCACVWSHSSISASRPFLSFSACVYHGKTRVLQPALCNWEYKGFCDLESHEQFLALAQPSMAGLWLLSPWELTLLPYCWASAHMADFSLMATKAVHLFGNKALSVLQCCWQQQGKYAEIIGL